MIISHTKEFYREVSTQNFVANFFHLSNQIDLKKEKHTPVENNGLTHCSLPKAMETEAETKLLSVIKNVRNQSMILLLLRTGMRIGELLNTQVQDILLAEQKIDIWEAEKTRIGRVVYFSEDASRALCMA